MTSNNLAKSAKNFELLGSKITIEFLYDNLRPVAKRSIVRNVSISIIHTLYGVNVSRVCRSIDYHRNSYYGVKKKIEDKLMQPESKVIDNLIRSYDLTSRLTEISCNSDQSSILQTFKQILEILKIDSDIRSQIL